MVKKKGPIWNFFSLKGKGVSCKYCFKDYKQAHAQKMTNHIKKCFKCPQDLKKVLDLNKTVNKVHGHPGPSSVSSEKCFFDDDDMQTSSQSLSSTPKPKLISSFVDHMDAQTNVSTFLIMIIYTFFLKLI